jgi:hypothetical protein
MCYKDILKEKFLSVVSHICGRIPMLYDRIQLDFLDILCPILKRKRKTSRRKMEITRKTNESYGKNQYQDDQYD